jgi:ABC-2 type transport system ATP-binding protein
MKPLEFNNIHRAYKQGENVLDGVTFDLKAGEVVGLLGKNGAGKTTLIRIAIGLIAAQSGTVRVLGLDPRENPLEVKRQIGTVSEDQILPPFMRVEAVLDLHRSLFPTWDRDLERELCQSFEIPLRTKIKKLSKGQARRVALLCAVAHRPKLLLLDEPAGGLDPAARREFLETSIRLLNESGSTILFSSHYMADVERLAGRIVLIHDGKVRIDSTLDDLHEEYALALVPHKGGVSRETIGALDECVGLRRRSDAIHAVFRLDADGTRELLEGRLGVKDALCRSVPLEEIFVELMGGDS